MATRRTARCWSPTARRCRADALRRLGAAVRQRLDAGERLLTLFGRADADDGVVTTAVLQAAGGRLERAARPRQARRRLTRR